MPSRKQILDFIATSDQPAGKREIARAFGLSGQDKIGLKVLLKDMVDKGAIGMKAKQGMWSWTDETIAREKARYEKALQAGFQILQSARSE